MRTAVLCLTVLGCALAVPNGYYHQEYNYKTSASAYKNNELQHKTDDQGYYRKDGDLEGRVRPRVDANSEHSEYVNPNLRNSDYNTGVIGAANGDLSSYGHLRADVGAHGARDHSEGLAHSDHIAGSRGAYSDYSAGSSYGSSSYGSSSQSYGTTSNLRSVTSRLQQELQRDLQNALQENRAYSHSSRLGVSELENELRQNLTNRLNAELASRYGQQGIRGGLSYTITGGRLQSTANYDNRELEDLKRQLEDTLLNQLRTQYRQSYSSQYEDYSSNRNVYGYTPTTVRPYYTTTYYRPVTTVRANYLEPYVQPSHTYTPVSNSQSLTTIASRVQSQLDARLNQLLEDAERRYFSASSSYSHGNFDVVLERLRNELRQNVSALFNDEVSRNYGTQIARDGNMYTVGHNGGTLGQYNYAVSDFENLRSQIERNLIEKLNRDFERNRSRWSQQYSSHSSFNSGSNVQYMESSPRYDTYSTPRYVYHNPQYVYSTPRYNTYDSDVEHLSTRPTSSNIASLISPTGGNQYHHVAGSQQSGYELSGASSSSASMTQLQRQLQQDLSRQLQSAISRGHYGSYSSSGAYNPQTYQVSLQQLTDELNRNLTRQLQEYSASGYYSAHGNFDQSQLASLRSQLQADLLKQLQQGLQESYSSSSSYSASSSSSSSNANYRPVRGFDNYQAGQYRSGSVATMQGEDCVGDDPNAYHSHRMKRSYQPYRSQPLGLSNGGYGANRYYNYGHGSDYRRGGSHYDQTQTQPQVEELGQQVDDSDLTQQVEDSDFDRVQLGSQNQQQAEIGQQVDDSDLTQQVEDVDFGGRHPGSHSQLQTDLGQQVDDSDLTQQVEDARVNRLQLGSHTQQHEAELDPDLTQQVEDSSFGKLQLGSHGQQQIELGQQVDNSDLTQQVEDSNFERGHSGSHSQLQAGLGQQVDDSDLTQQVEDIRPGRLQLGSHTQQHEAELDSDLTQQVEDSGFGKLQLGSQGQQQIELGQQVDDSDLTQQVEDSGFGRVSSGSQRQGEIGQQVDTSDLTQQVDDSGYGRVQLGNPGQQQIEIGRDNSDLTQQVEDSGFGHIGQGQQEDNSDLTQQVEEDTDEKLQSGSQRQQQITQNQLQLNQVQVEIAKKLEDDLSKQLKEAINSQQYDTTYSSLGSQSRQSYQRSYEQLLNELQSNLTKQLQQISSHPGRYDSSYSYAFSGNFNNRQIAKLRESIQRDLKKQLQTDLTEHYTYSNSWSTASNSHDTQFGHNQINSASQIYENVNDFQRQNFKDFTQKQAQLAQQLEEVLSKQLKSAIKTTYSSNSYYDSQVLYQNLIHELERNITKQLQAIGAGRDSYSYTFSNQQLNLLQKQLEKDLKLQLQQQVAGIRGNQPANNLTPQDVERSHSTEQIQDNTFENQGKPGQQIVDTDLTQQVEQNNDLTQQVEDNAFELGNQQQIGQEQVGADLKQQAEDSREYLSTQQNLGKNSGKLQFGNQQTEQQEFEDTGFDSLQFGGQREIVQHPSGQVQQTDVPSTVPKTLPLGNDQVTQQQLDVNQQLDNTYYRPQQIPSANLQIGNRPVTRRPIDSNNFLQGERDNQNAFGPLQGNYYIQLPNNLPTLNQVEQQQVDTNDAQQPSLVEPLTVPESDDLTQDQVNLGQQTIDSHLTGGQAEVNFSSQNPEIDEGSNDGKILTSSQNVLPTGQTSNKLNPSRSDQNLNVQVPSGQTGITSQGQFITQPQSLTDAENESDLLIQRLREAQRNRGQPSSGQGFTYVPYNRRPVSYSHALQYGGDGGRYTGGDSTVRQIPSAQPVQELNSNQQQESFDVYLNQQQAQFARELENELSKQLQDAVSENYYIYSSSGSASPQLYQISYQQLSQECHRNITRRLQEILSAGQYGSSSFSTYISLTNQQRERLLKQLQADLTKQLQQSLELSYGHHEQNAGHSFDYTGKPSSLSSGSSSYGSGHGVHYHSGNYGLGHNSLDQVHYGQQGETRENIETVSEFQPVQPQQADPVQNVEPIRSNYNTGVKGHGRRYPQHHVTQQQSSLPPTYEPGLPYVPSADVQNQPYGTPSQSPSAALNYNQPAVAVDTPAAELVAPPEVLPPSSADPSSPTEQIANQDLPWWKKFGNTVKQGAQSLKQKIVG